jgi:predicted phage terminase large subunit-like protein
MDQGRARISENALSWSPQPGPQSLLVTCTVPDLLFGGARGGGKSDGLLGDWGIHSARYPGRGRGLIVRRTYDELDELVQRSHEIYAPLGARWKPSRYTWTMPWGGFLKMRYLRRDEDAGRYQGHSYNWLAVDEAGNFPSFDPIKKLKATLRDKTGVPVKFRATANPGGVGHAEIKREYIDPSPPLSPFPDPDTGILRVFIPSRLQDNRLLMENDPEYAKRLRGSGPAWLVRAWLEGDWNAAPEGGVLKATWLRRYSEVPTEPARYMTVHSWDTAYKAQQHNDPSCCTVWAVTTTGYYLLGVHVERMDYPTLKKRVIDFSERDKPHVVLIEDKASGQSLIQELRSATQIPVKAIEPDGDKLTRALAVSDMIESGLVHVPERAPWLLDYELELTTFPTKGAHDDQVDSTTQFLAWARTHAARRLEIIGGGIKRTSYMQTSEGGFGTVRGGIDTRGF